MTDVATVDLHFIDMPAEEATADTTPLVVIHGLLGSADNWRSHLKVWQRSRRVIALDLRNHGHSPHAEGMRYATMADDVIALLDKLSIERAHVLGHSMGGKVAISLARLAPKRVASLIVADIAPVAYEHGHDDVFAALDNVRQGQPKNRREADDLLAEHVDFRPTRLFLATNLVRNDDNVMALRVGLDQIKRGYSDIIGVPDGEQPYDGPALVLRGGDSHYVADDMVPALREVLPRARVVTLKNAGHWLHADQPEAFQQAVMAFIDAQ
ncbi:MULTISPECIES: alpha/beta fold hydrolase [Halomonadaceae]|jgi:esterase|uniref:alpha/beta fold hydrolase n=1 Tax=Halomonadaceae TaxID=28256 RepID=UPI000C329CC9|nr:alpha/beta fold hydrolase [Halomonas sp. MES3-P3E]PKG49295.1 alpha/beta hydrolase [Halomonas sp. MES3-P3E]|tara:strand:+ start:8872 stop:9675 length:804 start_codon:yes stop_codon:yes gene_type:complete